MCVCVCVCVCVCSLLKNNDPKIDYAERRFSDVLFPLTVSNSTHAIVFFFYLQHASLQIVILHAWNDHHKHCVYLV